MNYDPNMNFCGKTTVQTVRLTLGRWDHRLVLETKVGGNCLGLNVIRAALENVSEDNDMVDLVDAKGDVLTVVNEDGGIEWLSDMLIGAEIVDIVPSEGSSALAKYEAAIGHENTSLMDADHWCFHGEIQEKALSVAKAIFEGKRYAERPETGR